MSSRKPPLKPSRRPAYCYCTECDHQTIVQRQQKNPLPFEQAMHVHCACGDRCGYCLCPLAELFRANDCYFN